jgi:hypothetical protein
MAPPRRPDPEPIETDDVAVITWGTALWGLALVVIVALGDRLDDEGRDSWAWIAAAGFFLGLVGIRYVRRRRAALRTSAPAPAPGDAA